MAWPMAQNSSARKALVVSSVIAAGLLTAVSHLFMQFFLAWLCLIPLCYALERQRGRGAFLWCPLYRMVTASVTYYWTIPVATRFAGTFTLYSLLLYGGVVLYFSLCCAAFGIGYRIQRVANPLAGIESLMLIRWVKREGSHVNPSLVSFRRSWLHVETARKGPNSKNPLLCPEPDSDIRGNRSSRDL